MKKIVTVLLILLNISLFAQDEVIMEKHREHLMKLAKANYPGDSNIDVTYYGLDLNISHSPNYLTGMVTVRARAVSADLTQFFLDLQTTMTVDSVKNESGSLVFNHQNDKVTITLERAYAADEEFSADIYYQGVPGSSGFGSYENTTHAGQPVIWTLSEPYGSSDWWPAKDTPSDKADSSDMWMTADEDMVSVSNGTLQEVVDNGDGTKTYKWKNSYPIAHYLISMAITNYQEYVNYFHYTDTDSMPIHHYNYPEHWDAVRKDALDKTPYMIEVFTEKYGDYPFLREKYGHAEFGWGGAMEHQTCTSIGSFSEHIIAHELAHQWFGDKITCIDWHNIWINEGFATYSEAVYFEEAYGKEYYDEYILNKIEPPNYGAAKNAVGSLYVQDISGTGTIFNYALSYNKGAVVLHMLRGVLGDDVFFDVMKTYAGHPDYAYGVAGIDDFKLVAEDVSGVDLDYFFDEWHYGENYPKYSYDWGYNNYGGSTSSVHMTISQSTNSNPTFFTMPIQIKVNFADGDTIVTVFNDQQEQDFEFDVEGIPTGIEFDPGNWIMKDILGVTGTDGEEIELNQYHLFQNYPNPFNPSTTIHYYIPEETEVSLKLYDMLGHEIALLKSDVQQAGKHFIKLNTTDFSPALASGVYIYKLEAGAFSDSRKMMLLK